MAGAFTFDDPNNPMWGIGNLISTGVPIVQRQRENDRLRAEHERKRARVEELGDKHRTEGLTEAEFAELKQLDPGRFTRTGDPAAPPGGGGGFEFQVGGAGPVSLGAEPFQAPMLSPVPSPVAGGAGLTAPTPAMPGVGGAVGGGLTLPLPMGGTTDLGMPGVPGGMYPPGGGLAGPGGKVPTAPGTDKGRGGGIGGVLSGIGRYIGKNPELITGVLGSAADVYGAAKDRKQREKEWEEEMEFRRQQQAAAEEEARKRQEIDRVKMILNAIGAFS